MSTDPKSVRWWPAILIGVLAVFALLGVWIPDEINHQVRVMITTVAVMAWFVSSLAWFLGLSRFSRRVRLRGGLILVVLIGLAVFLFRFRGFTGDLAPAVEWRWSSEFFVSGDSPGTLDLRTTYPQFLGPDRNAMLPGIEIEPDWERYPPRLLWRKSVGEGWSAFAVSGRFAVTQEQRGEAEVVVCYDLLTGRENWRHEDAVRFEHPLAGIGPRATPTISDDRVYALGATGILNCLDLATGQKIWSRDIVKENGATVAEYGMSGSPLVFDDRVVVSAGGPDGRSLVAYDRAAGGVVWGGGDRRAGYSSPRLTTLAQTEQILIFNYCQVAGHDPATGRLLWEHPWPNTQHVAQPVPLPGGRLFVSTGYGVGCELVRVARDERGGFAATTVWKTSRLKAKFANVVHKDGYVYGLDDGILVCLDLQDGQREWKRGRYGHGQLILVGDLLLIQTEPGDVVLVDATPEGHTERARFSALDGRAWNNPAFAAPYLLVRNDREAACYELALGSD